VRGPGDLVLEFERMVRVRRRGHRRALARRDSYQCGSLPVKTNTAVPEVVLIAHARRLAAVRDRGRFGHRRSQSPAPGRGRRHGNAGARADPWRLDGARPRRSRLRGRGAPAAHAQSVCAARPRAEMIRLSGGELMSEAEAS